MTTLDFSAIRPQSLLDSRGWPTCLFIVVEGEDPGFDIFVNGHALARNEDALERLALRLNVHPLLEFFSADENSMALLLEQGVADDKWERPLPRTQWFSASDGLRTVCALIDFLAATPAALGWRRGRF